MKIGLDALATAQNDSESVKHENGTRRPRYRHKRVRNEKHANGTRRPLYRQKRVLERKT
jgi:hypothetical protein